MTAALLHLSDPHLTGAVEPTRRLRAVLELPLPCKPDAVIATGDITDAGEPEGYRAFAATMGTDVPWLAVPGNHDVPETLRSTLGQDPSPVLDVGGTRVVGIDVMVPGKGHGFLTPEAAELAARRADGAQRVVLALHHPPTAIGHPIIDRVGLTNPTDLVDLVRGLGNVVAVLTGHVHTPLASSLDGVPVLGAPGIASALAFDPKDELVVLPERAAGVAFHVVHDDGTLTTTFHHT